MPFNNFTLVPGGSFIMCESIGAFDDNMPAPDIPAETVEDTETVQLAEETPIDRLRKAVEADKYRDLVVDTIVSLRTIYQGIIIPLVNRPLDQYQGEDIVKAADAIAADCTATISALNMLIEKIRIATKIFGNMTHQAIAYAPVRDNLGFLIKNMKAIEQDGFETVQVHHTYHPAFDEYSIGQIISSALNAPDILKHDILTLDMLARIVGSDAKICTMFRDTMDMLDTMLSEDDAALSRRIRQETMQSYTYHLSDIIKWNIPNDSECVPAQGDENTLLCRMVQALSVAQRKVRQKCYDIQVSCSEQETPNIEYCNKQLYSCSVLLFNMFVITTAICLSMAYKTNRIFSEKNAIENWIQSILKHYKH